MKIYRIFLAAFSHKLLHEVCHFTGRYRESIELISEFWAELDKFFLKGALEYGIKAECLYDACKATVPDTFTGRSEDLQEIWKRLSAGSRLLLVLINAEGGMGKAIVCFT